MNINYISSLIDFFCMIYIYSDTPMVRACCWRIIDEIVDRISKEPHSIEKKIEKAKNELEDKIRAYLADYKNDEVNVGLSFLKAYYKVRISNTNIEKNDFEDSIRHDEVSALILLENERESGGKNSIINGRMDIMISFRLAYYYCVLVENMEHFEEQKEKYNRLLENDLKLIFEEGFFDSEEYSKYMESLLFMNLYEVPEDSRIKTSAIKELLQEKKLSMDEIRCLQGNAVKTYLGFSFEDLWVLNRFLNQHVNNGAFFLWRRRRL